MNFSLETGRQAPAISAAPRWSALAPHKEALRCPISPCGGTLFPDARGPFHDAQTTELTPWGCGSCSHQGWTASQGFQVQRVPGSDRHDYVVSYGPALSTLTIVLSMPLISLFSRSMSPAQTAIYIAEWALLTGRTNGTFRASSEMAAMVDCYDYFLRLVAQDWRVGTAA